MVVLVIIPSVSVRPLLVLTDYFGGVLLNLPLVDLFNVGAWSSGLRTCFKLALFMWTMDVVCVAGVEQYMFFWYHQL